MSESITCPTCYRTLPIADPPLERPNFCPGCGGALGVIQQPQPSPPANRAVPQTIRNLPDAWNNVRSGLLLQGVGHLLLVGGWGFFTLQLMSLPVAREVYQSLGLGMSRFSRNPPSPGFIATTTFLGFLFLLAGWVVGIVAGALWTDIPSRGPARSLTIAYLILNGLVLLLVCFAAASPDWFRLLDGDWNISFEINLILALLILEVARLTILATVLREFASCLRMSQSESRGGFFVFSTPLLLVGVLLLSVPYIAEPSTATTFMLVWIANLGVYLGVLFLGLLLMIRLRNRLQPQNVPGDDGREQH